MIRYFILMFFLLGLSGLTAFVTLREKSRDVVASCGGLATFPVTRLADAGDTGAMVFLGKKLSHPHCTAHERQRGARFLSYAATMGNSDAQFALGQLKMAADDTQAGLALIRQSAAAGHASAHAYLAVRAAPRDGGQAACLGLIAMHYPFEDDADHLLGACD